MATICRHMVIGSLDKVCATCTKERIAALTARAEKAEAEVLNLRIEKDSAGRRALKAEAENVELREKLDMLVPGWDEITGPEE